jgi:membrane protein required for colicin V production
MLDLIVLGVILVFLLIGLFTGFLAQVLRLAATVGAAIVSMEFSGPIAQSTTILADHPAAREVLFPLGVFMCAYLVLAILARLIVALFRKTSTIGPADRLFGGLFGALKAAVLCYFLLSVMLATEATTGGRISVKGAESSIAARFVREHPLDTLVRYADPKTWPALPLDLSGNVETETSRDASP